MINFKFISILIALSMPNLNALVASTKSQFSPWGPYRGVNIVAKKASKKDFRDISKYGASLVRLSFTDMPMIRANPSYGINMNAIDKLDKCLQWAKDYNVKIVLDPHTVPGSSKPTTTFTSDRFWHSSEMQKYWQELWTYLSKRYKNNTTIVGYDLLNEPSVQRGFPKQGIGSWNALMNKLIKAIRKNDTSHTIIIETAVGKSDSGNRLNRVKSITKLRLPKDRNIVVSPHIYIPPEFTRQGLSSKKRRYTYPGFINGVKWDKNKLKHMLEPIRKFQERHDIPIFIGEFGVTRAAGNSGNVYLQDIISIFNTYGWSWAYQSFRSGKSWDPEIPIGANLKKSKKTTTPRMDILRNGFMGGIN